MARSAAKILADIRVFKPVDGNWLPLDELLAEFWDTGKAKRHVRELLSVLERFPEDDGEGVLWSIVHGLEEVPGYESELIQSIRRQPSELGVAMVGRLLNSGVSQADEASLVGILREVVEARTAPRSVQKSAADWIQKHAEPDAAADGGEM
jgi:hypothetical protein